MITGILGVAHQSHHGNDAFIDFIDLDVHAKEIEKQLGRPEKFVKLC